jgi:hypothetical protein
MVGQEETANPADANRGWIKLRDNMDGLRRGVGLVYDALNPAAEIFTHNGS